MECNLIERAIDLAKRAHAKQKRKYGNFDYIVHPSDVAGMVSNITGVTNEEIAAAWLHDVFEDCEKEFCDELILKFPYSVVKLVRELTNVSKGSSAPRRVRKQMDRDHLKTVSVQAKRIKLIDRICNLRDMKDAPRDFKYLYVMESQLLLDAINGVDDNLECELQNIIHEMKCQLSK